MENRRGNGLPPVGFLAPEDIFQLFTTVNENVHCTKNQRTYECGRLKVKRGNSPYRIVSFARHGRYLSLPFRRQGLQMFPISALRVAMVCTACVVGEFWEDIVLRLVPTRYASWNIAALGHLDQARIQIRRPCCISS